MSIRSAVGRQVSRWRFKGSDEYWQQRYADAGNSGPGSYGVLAKYKADVLNEFVKANGVSSVIEFGCGDGNQLALAEYPRYAGLDVAARAVEMCSERFADDTTKSFFHYDPAAWVDRAGFLRCDLALSLDVIYHLVEDGVFQAHMRHLFAASGRFVIVYATDREISGKPAHVRHRHWTPWVSANMPDWELIETRPNSYPEEYGGHADWHIYRRR